MSDHLQTSAAMKFIKSMLVGFNIAFWVSLKVYLRVTPFGDVVTDSDTNSITRHEEEILFATFFFSLSFLILPSPAEQ
jgi:hypothetical protein